MAISQSIKDKIQALKREYDIMRQGKETLLAMIDEVEIPESVYNSNAIENSTLTLKETEKILLEMEVSRDVSLREVFEAKNLARVMGYIRAKAGELALSQDTMLLLHQMLIGGINDAIAGRFRVPGEYVRVGTHIASPPERVESLIGALLIEYSSGVDSYFLDAIAKFHLDLEDIHPFNDGNGRIGRVLMNLQLEKLGFPPIIIRDKEKRLYYDAFAVYEEKKKTAMMEKIIARSLMESLHKRIAYMKGQEIVAVSAYAKKRGESLPALLNAARRQSIPAFREKGVWKISAVL